MNPESRVTNPLSARSAGRPDCLTVTELNGTVAELLERSFPLVRVAGEISNFTKAASGHWYFSLKDDAAQVRCAMFRGRSQFADFLPHEGDAVEVFAQVRLYEARGDYQLLVESIHRAGRGGFLEAFNRLKESLAREGLFDVRRKRVLPKFVRTVGVVTSPDAAALRDVATTLAAQAPHVAAVVYPTPVQGEGAAAAIAKAIALANARREIDGLEALIVCRGGGSIEDLWAFNEEIVARAIAASVLPVVTGVGHETDITIADFVADVRAPTPTGAAQMVSRATDEWHAQIQNLQLHLMRAAARRWEQAAMRLDAAAGRVISPAQRLESLAARVDGLSWRLRGRASRNFDAAYSRWRAACAAHRPPELLARTRLVGDLNARLRIATQAQVANCTARMAALSDLLDAVSPQATLRRGYAIVERQGHVMASASDARLGDAVQVRLHDGTLDARVEEVRVPGADKR